MVAGLVNASAVGMAAAAAGPPVTVVACGERWEETQTLRPCLEGELGAGP
ncbi:MAG TPA: hypothetical protein VNM16_06425 [Bacillota bacterium]|nr:hypothetical protein [Bacillota bacterium]